MEQKNQNNQDSHNNMIVITGATSGIGLAAAEQLVQGGYSVIGVGRSPERCRASESRLRTLNPQVQVHYLVADLSLQSEVNRLSGAINRLLDSLGRDSLEGLLNVAGTFTYWLTLTQEGIEMQWAVNHLAPFLLTNRLLPLLQAAPSARVVTVSSASHYGARIHWDDPQLRRRYNCLTAYGSTKLANVLFTLELNRRLGSESTVRAFAADPGLVKTEIGMKGNPAIAGWVWKIRASGGVPPEESARGIVYLVTESSIQGSREIYWKDGRPKKPSKRALDEPSAERLWALSEKYCGLTTEGSHGD